MTLADAGLQPTELCAHTVTDQSEPKSTVKFDISVVPETLCVNVPPSLLAIVIRYWSTGLLPGTAAVHSTTIVAVVAPCADQKAVTPVGTDGAIEAATVVTVTGFDAAPGPPDVMFVTVIWYFVLG